MVHITNLENFQKNSLKKFVIIVSITILCIVSFCSIKLHLAQPEERFGLYGTGMEALQNGFSSTKLYLGREQLARFDEYNGLRMYISSKGETDSGEHYVVGNIDYVVFLDIDDTGLHELQDVILKNKITITYLETPTGRILTGIQFESLPGNEHILIYEDPIISIDDNKIGQAWLYDDRVGGMLKVNFNDFQYNNCWPLICKFELSLDEESKTYLHIKTFDKTYQHLKSFDEIPIITEE